MHISNKENRKNFTFLCKYDILLLSSFKLCISLLRLHDNYNYNILKGEIYHEKKWTERGNNDSL